MADEPELADADVPGDPTADELDLEAMGLEDVELTEEEQVALAAAKARPVRRSEGGAEPSAKGRPTPRQRRAKPGEERRRTTPVQFVRESVAELKKVVWPTGSQLQQYFVVVLVFVLIMIAIVSVLDLGFGTLMLKLLG
ncbi:Protein translocase subunit SecE [Propionicimonas sp. T2.31MG-18]|uniref:preprotein translocase subunit SecE n=1 Tax=Propionicimonas sp. T2.31MG-18 TaxID=3157620 RepID=UPI0035F0241B